MAEERVQRRLAAILAADVVGYSRLMEADEEGTLARMKKLRNDVIDPKIAEYNGRIFKTTGDGLLAEFPSAVDAVRHAVDVQRSIAQLNADVPEDKRIAFRIGISLGDVMGRAVVRGHESGFARPHRAVRSASRVLAPGHRSALHRSLSTQPAAWVGQPSTVSRPH